MLHKMKNLGTSSRYATIRSARLITLCQPKSLKHLKHPPLSVFLELAVNRISIVMAAAMVLAACGGPLEVAEEEQVGQIGDEIRQVAPTGKNVGTQTSTVQRTRYRVKYHNGQLMLGTVHVYFIFYGNWLGNTAPQ